MEELASKLSDSSELAPSSDGNEVQQLLGGISDRAKEDKFLYTKFFAIGLFRLLELTGHFLPALFRASAAAGYMHWSIFCHVTSGHMMLACLHKMACDFVREFAMCSCVAACSAVHWIGAKIQPVHATCVLPRC